MPSRIRRDEVEMSRSVGKRLSLVGAGPGTSQIATTFDARLFKVTVSAKLFHSSFFIKDLFKTFKCLFYRFTAFNFYLNLRHV